MTSRADVVRVAREWIDTPYQNQQSLKGVAVDCGGLVAGIGRELGLINYCPNAYTPNPDGVTLRKECERWLLPVYGRVMPGMVGLFWYSQRRFPQHLAVFTDYRGLGMIHAISRRGAFERHTGAVREHRPGSFWGIRFVRAFDYPGLTD
jgi:hypothetical protein